MNEIKKHCHATPDEVEELYKRSLTHFLMLDKIPQFNLKGNRITEKFTACISPSRTKKEGKCAFKDQDGNCVLIKDGLELSGCADRPIPEEGVKHIGFKQRSQEWITDKGAACIKFFAQMMKP